MTTGYIRYTGKYKYQLESEYKIPISIKPEMDITTAFIDLSPDFPDGRLNRAQ